MLLGIGGLTISETSDSSTLSIVFLENVHVGEYLCTVRNTLGEDLATAMILLEGMSKCTVIHCNLCPSANMSVLYVQLFMSVLYSTCCQRFLLVHCY